MRISLAIVCHAVVCVTGLCADNETTPRLRCNDLRVGQVGLITINGTNPVHAKAIQVISPNAVIMEWSRNMHWVEMPTAGMVDGGTYVMNRVMRITGTKTYTTVLGAQRTILAMEAVPDADLPALQANHQPRGDDDGLPPANPPDPIQPNLADNDLRELIQNLQSQLEQRQATMAEYPTPELTFDMLARGIRPAVHPKHQLARDQADALKKALSELLRFQKIGPEKTAIELREAGRKAANKWVLTQTRGTVKRLLEKPVLRNRALADAGPFLTKDMKDAFAEGYLQECERYALSATLPRSQ